MSQIAGVKTDITETMADVGNVTEYLPVAVSGQRKTVVLTEGTLLTVFRAEPANIWSAISTDGGLHWDVQRDIFSVFRIDKMKNAFNPALAVDKGGVVHMAFRAFNPAISPYRTIWYSASKDGKDWAEPVEITQEPPHGSYYRGYPVIGTGPDGQVYVVFDHKGNLYFQRSLDGGGSWQPEVQLTTAGASDTRPSMTVDQEGTIYIAYSEFGYLYCLRGTQQGTAWQSRKIFGSSRGGGEYPSIALDEEHKPVIAYRSTPGLGPDNYQAIHVHRQLNDWKGDWVYAVIDPVYGLGAALRLHMPCVAVTKDGVIHLTYNRYIELASVPIEKWPRSIVYTSSKNGNDWTPLARITEAEDGEFSPQVWPNLYWQPNAPAKKGFAVVWDGKDEKAKAAGGPWLARSFVSSDFVTN